ncbi:MAG: restriction endonuclease [Nitrososphaeraceae archaeon]
MRKDSSINPNILLKLLSGIQTRKMSMQEIKLASGIQSNDVFSQVLSFLQLYNISEISNENNFIYFNQSDKIKIAILALKRGCDILSCSKNLTWRDFESFVSHLLEMFGYNVKSNVYLTKPTVQLDVIGTKNNCAITIDCKHWKYNNKASLSKYAEKQIYRTQLFLKKNTKIKTALPVIVTLFPVSYIIAGRVPITSITTFESFLDNLHMYEEKFTLERSK